MAVAQDAPVAESDPGPEASAERDGAAVSIERVSHSFGELRALDRLELSVAPREVVGIVGPSGCGKSTLLELIAGLREPSAGRVAVAAQSPSEERLARCAYMPQRDLLLPWLSALDNAALAVRNRGARRPAARAAAAPLFERFGLDGFEQARPDQLSGGMRQRVAFVRTLISGKPVLLLDEPFASLDALTRAEMQEWLAGALEAEPRTVVMVTHDVEEALYVADRVVVLSARPGRAVAELAAPGVRARPRDDAVTDPGFAEVRHRALAALAEGSQ